MEIIFTPDPELVEEIELKDLEKRLESQWVEINEQPNYDLTTN